MNTTSRRIGVVAAVAALLLAVTWYFALFRPESHHLKAANTARAAADARAQSLTQQISSLDALVKQVPHDQMALATLKTSIPDNPDLSDALGQLHQAATSSGVQLTSVSPTPPPTTSSSAKTGSASGGSPSSGSSQASGTSQAAGPSAISLSLSVTGSYQQLVGFVTRLDNMARTVVLNALNVNSGNNGGLTASMTAQIFYAGSPTP
jgi:Tfp pilus assembly protein PilO